MSTLPDKKTLIMKVRIARELVKPKDRTLAMVTETFGGVCDCNEAVMKLKTTLSGGRSGLGPSEHEWYMYPNPGPVGSDPHYVLDPTAAQYTEYVAKYRPGVHLVPITTLMTHDLTTAVKEGVFKPEQHKRFRTLVTMAIAAARSKRN